MAYASARPLHAVHVSFHADLERRSPAALLDAWPTLPAVACAAAKAGVRVTVVQTAHRDETLIREDVSIHFVGDATRARHRVLRQVASLRPDIVHVMGFHHALAVRAATRMKHRPPVLVQDHGAVAPAGWRRIWWRSAFRGIAGGVFTVREQSVPWTGTVLRADLPIFEVLPGSTNFAPGSQAAARAETGLSGDPCLLWTSHLNPNKDPLTMLAAVEQAVADLPDARLWCCFGEAPMLGEVRARIENSALLRDRVVLLGRQPHDRIELLQRAADFFLQTSHREASGFSLIEAMACGNTPIVTDIPAARWIVGNAGSLTPVGDASAMSAVLVSRSRSDRASQRAAARAKFDADLSFDSIGQQLRGAYESIAGARS